MYVDSGKLKSCTLFEPNAHSIHLYLLQVNLKLIATVKNFINDAI